MNDEVKEGLNYIFNLLRCSLISNKLGIACDGENIIIVSAEELVEKRNIAECTDGIVIKMNSLVRFENDRIV